MKTEEIILKVKDDDGSTSEMLCFVARPPHETRAPGLFVLQEAFGVNHHIRDVAQRFAKEGYVVISPELFHRTAPKKFESPYDDFNVLMPHFKDMTTEKLTSDLKATYKWLAHDSQVHSDRIGAIGYCMGGRTTFLANGILPLKVAVSYYGSRIPTLSDYFSKQSGPMMFVWGGLDKNIDVAQRKQVMDGMKAANRPFLNVEFSEADHGFFCDERSSYNAVASDQAWPLTLAFLKSYL